MNGADSDSLQRLQAAGLTCWEYSPLEQRVTWLNGSYLSLLGLPETSAACNTMAKARELIHPDDREAGTFWFELPMTEVDSPVGAERNPLTRVGRRILVVDDNETSRRMLLMQLSHAGYDVTLASGGSEALAIMRSAAARPFAAYLSKPVKPRELLATLERVSSRDAQEWHSQTQWMCRCRSCTGTRRRSASGVSRASPDWTSCRIRNAAS